jgi:hypothetical protein
MVFNITEIDADSGAIQGLEITNCGTNYNPGEQLNLVQDDAGHQAGKRPAQDLEPTAAIRVKAAT